jgi:ornithine carbamoyltransferase
MPSIEPDATAGCVTAPSVPKDFVSILDFSPAALNHCLRLSALVKRDRPKRKRAPTATALEGLHVALLFEKPSLRTRATFEVAVHELGGDVVAPAAHVIFGGRETTRDVAANLDRWVAGAVVRTFGHEGLREFAAAAPRLHVINALTDAEHPCQALADYLTLEEHLGPVEGKTVAFVGDGNNVAASLAHLGVALGATVHVASPAGYDLPETVVDACRRTARNGATVRLFRDPGEAVAAADAVYTDVWASMGQELEAAARADVFRPYQVNAGLMAAARPGALFMHCLPAHRGDEVTDDVIDSSVSVVLDQAENRLHTQKALLVMLLAPEYGAC